MRDTLPRTQNNKYSANVNLDTYKNPWTYLVVYTKNENVLQYFHDFGDVKPPKEVMSY